MADFDLSEFEQHLTGLWAMPLEAAEALKQKLYAQRRLIDGQILVVDQVIAKHKTDGVVPPIPAAGWPVNEPWFPASGPPNSGVRQSRRITFLSIMARDPNRDWHLQELKPLMVAAGVVEDNSAGTNRVSAAAAETKKNKEVDHVGPSLYRITEKGLAALKGG